MSSNNIADIVRFLPACGYKTGETLSENGISGYYWSSSVMDDAKAMDVGIRKEYSGIYSDGDLKTGKFSVRLFKNK